MNRDKVFTPPKIIELTEGEFLRLIFCIFLDFIEFAFPILLGPVAGDILDLIGATLGFLLFGWIGIINLIELIPYADYVPLFLITWLVWLQLRRRREKRKMEELLRRT